MKKRSIFVLFFSFALFFTFGLSAKALELKSGNLIHIQEDEFVSGNMYVAGNDVIVDGKIAGDLIGAAKSIVINGELAGDLISAAEKIEVNGRVEGNIRSISETFSLSGFVGRNINFLGSEFYLNPESFVAWDVLAAGQTLFLKGKINGELNSYGENIFIDGEIEKDVNLKLDGSLQSLNIKPSAVINGNLNYSAIKETLISEDNVAGLVNYNYYKKQRSNPINNFPSIAFKILTALAVASFLIFGLKKINGEFLELFKSFASKDILPSLLFFIILPIAIFILFITIIGIPLSLTLLSFYLVILYLAKVFVMIFSAKLIAEKIGKNKNFFLFLLLSIIIFTVVFALPYVGNIISTLAILFGLSVLIKYVRNKSKNI